MMAVVVSLLLLLFSGVAHSAQLYWLNPIGGVDTNSGTSEGAAWKTFTKAKTAMSPGDTLNIVGGTYTPADYQNEPNDGFVLWDETHRTGTHGAPITIQAKPGDTVIFDGGRQANWILFSPHNGLSPTTARYIVIKNLEFRHYTSAAFASQFANYLALVNCSMHDFYDGTSGDMGTYKNDHVIFKNNRSFNIGDTTFSFNGTGDHAEYLSLGSQYVVMDGNTMERVAGYAFSGYGGGDYDFTSRNWIVRNNTVINARTGVYNASNTNYQNLYTYNNTFYQEAVPMPSIDTQQASSFFNFHLGGLLTNTVIKNNIGYGYVGTAPIWNDDTSQFQGSLYLDYNLWTNLTTPGTVYSWDFTTYNLVGFQGATTFEDHSQVANPLFANAGARNFALLDGSPAIDAGTTLTTTATSGSGTTVRLTDAGYFHDGYGMIDGDTIRIGSTTVTITNVNYDTNDIIVTPGLTWTAGQPVSFPYNGVAPDMGAFESGSSVVEPPVGLQAHWRLDTGSGTSLVDATGHGHTGVLSGSVAWSPGHVGPSAVTFDGVAMKGTVTPAFPYTQYTWALWIQGASAPTTETNSQPLVNGSDPDNWGFNWSNMTATFRQAAYQQDAFGAYVAAQLTTPLLAHVWYFVVGTFDGSLLRVYLNGQLQASTAVSSVATGVGDFGLGNNPNRARWFAGSLDNVQVYNTALSGTQILALYRTQAGAPHHRLVMR